MNKKKLRQMKLSELKRCINNSWCVEKHWDAIIETVLASQHLYFHQAVKIEPINEHGHKALTRLREAIKNLEGISWNNEKSL